jgi:prepilin signal peptidase PulO-like enzyme (type II secretory pathway)
MALVYLIMLASLIIISAIDIKNRIINTRALMILGLGGIAAIVFNKELGIVNGIAAMLVVFILLWMVSYCTKGSIGMGDAKLCAVLALYLGVENSLYMLALSIISCGVAAAFLIISSKANKNRSLPFAPFVAVSTLAVLIL